MLDYFGRMSTNDVNLLSREGSTGFVKDVSGAFFGDDALIGFGDHGRVGFRACNEKRHLVIGIYQHGQTGR